MEMMVIRSREKILDGEMGTMFRFRGTHKELHQFVQRKKLAEKKKGNAVKYIAFRSDAANGYTLLMQSMPIPG